MTAHRPRGRRPDEPLVDLASVFADDVLLDSLAAGRGSSGLGALGDDDPLPELFQSWRNELTAKPLPAPPSTRAAAAALSAVVEPRPARALRPVLAASVAIVALLLGSAVLFTRTATEHSPLWGIASVIWQDRAASVDARNQAKQAISEAKAALEAGSPEVAEVKLQQAEEALRQVSHMDNPVDVHDLLVTLKDQSKNDQQTAAAQSTRASASSSASAPTSTTLSPPAPVPPGPPASPVAVPDARADVPSPSAVAQAQVRVAPPVAVDPFLSLVEPVSSAKPVTPPLLPPADPVSTDPGTPVATEPAGPTAPVDVTVDVPVTPLDPVTEPPVVTDPTPDATDPTPGTTDTTDNTDNTGTAPGSGDEPGSAEPGDQGSSDTSSATDPAGGTGAAESADTGVAADTADGADGADGAGQAHGADSPDSPDSAGLSPTE